MKRPGRLATALVSFVGPAFFTGLALAGGPGCDKPDGATGERPALDAARQQRGRELFARHGCAGCHGTTGHGDGPAAAGMSPPPRDFRRAGAPDEAAIRRILKTGVPGSNMVGFDHLPDAERTLLARYVIYLRGRE